MTPEEHIAAAEEALTEAKDLRDRGYTDDAADILAAGMLHALVALAVEAGVPHTTTPPAAS